MPKLKTKSSAKKRFKISAKGKVITAQAGKRHGMIKRTNSQIRKLRGTTTMSKQDSKIVKSYMPYSLSCLLYTSPSPRDGLLSRMPSSA